LESCSWDAAIPKNEKRAEKRRSLKGGQFEIANIILKSKFLDLTNQTLLLEKWEELKNNRLPTPPSPIKIIY